VPAAVEEIVIGRCPAAAGGRSAAPTPTVSMRSSPSAWAARRQAVAPSAGNGRRVHRAGVRERAPCSFSTTDRPRGRESSTGSAIADAPHRRARRGVLLVYELSAVAGGRRDRLEGPDPVRWNAVGSDPRGSRSASTARMPLAGGLG
jgi:hypothetical protein